jgi:hypothetical protein
VPAVWCLIVAVALGCGGPAVAAPAARATGESIYRDGLLPSGGLLRGARESGMALEGQAAACVECHHRSGLGGYEGTTTVPPILGRYLFRTRQTNVQDLNLPHVTGFVPNRDAYSDATLTETLRTGVAPGGRILSYLMPRYDLDAESMRLLIDYLRDLGSAAVPGVSEAELHFATIVTPDADPAAAEAMVSVLQVFFGVQNKAIAGEVRPLKSDREFMYRVTRRWRLHVWRLEGKPDTWRRQLESRLAAEPVFAVIAGIGARTWQPIHAFCEDKSIPCLLPNVDLPVVAEQDFYPFYWSRGVLLEADLVARALRAEAASKSPRGRVVQVYRADDIGTAGAAALRAQLKDGERAVVDLVLSGPRSAVSKALAALHAGDQVVLWVRDADLAALPNHMPAGVDVYASGLMADLERASPPVEWRQRIHLAYPFDLPDLRRVRMNFPLGWMRVQQLPVVDERVQATTYIACQILAEAIGSMLDSFVRDFLIERIESMLSTRLVSGYYPRLGLAPGQRFASKGGYMVHFAAPSGTRIVAEGDWTTP